VKKIAILIILLLFLLLSSISYAELIDGPANIREKPEGELLFSLNNDIRVHVESYRENWYRISLQVWIKKADVINEKQIKKDSVLYDSTGVEIGKTLNNVTPNQERKLLYNNFLQRYTCELSGYTFKNNVQSISRAKAQIIVEKFHENPRNQARAIAHIVEDVIIEGISYYYFEIAFEKGASAEVFVNSVTGDIHSCDLNSTEDKDKVLDSISEAVGADPDPAMNPIKDGTIYENKILGLAFTIPKSWDRKYKIVANQFEINVYFVPKKKTNPETSGFLFGIMKRSMDIYEGMLDTVGKRYIKAKGVVYVIGGPTDVSYDGEEFADFLKISNGVRGVVATIHEI
jgi:hypothetical protein